MKGFLINNIIIIAEWVETCYIKKPEFEKCSTKAVQRLFDQLPKGVPEIGLAPLDPLHVPIITVSRFIIL